ncbi:MAG: ribonuclease HI [Spirochaetia bacterium]|jgi:ribonuclease HI|nr:ribonuclease HI [Spirochaetia bacterium]
MNLDKIDSVDIYTDGGCSGNPGPGGWGFVILCGKDILKGSGSDRATTNNRMELKAVIQALHTLNEKCGKQMAGSGLKVRIFTDSTYVKKGISEWIEKWEKNGWKTADKKDVKNRELWIELKALSDSVNPEWNWVKGHSGNKWNEECDRLVRAEIDSR